MTKKKLNYTKNEYVGDAMIKGIKDNEDG